MSEFGDQFANMFNVNTPVKNDSLYVSLTPRDDEVCGVGVSLILVHDPPLHVPSDHYQYINIIQSVAPNTSASKEGLEPDDIILAVNGEDLEYDRQVYLPEDVSKLIQGPAGSEVAVVVQRGYKRVRVVLTREPLDVTPASPTAADYLFNNLPLPSLRPVSP